MPHFENLINDGAIDHGQLVSALENPSLVSNDKKGVDVTSLRVKTYVHILQTSYTLKSTFKYLSGYCHTTHQYKSWKHQLPVYSQSEVRKTIVKTIAQLKRTFFSKSNKFQSAHTKIWNPNFNKVAKF